MQRDADPTATSWLSSGRQRFTDSVQDYALFMLDAQGCIASWNKGAERIKGYTADEVIGQPYSMLFDEADVRAGKPADILRVAATVGRFADEAWRVRKDGTRFWANVSVTAIRDPDGTLVGYGKITRDMTDRRQAEAALRLSEERFRLLIDGVRDYAIFMLDATGIVTTWNTGAERITGYAAREIIGKSIVRFYPPDDVASGKPTMELAIAAKTGRYEEEGWRVRKDGGPFWASVVITALRDGDGQLSGYAKVTRDLTERRLADEARFKLLKAEEAVRQRDDFLSLATHELRLPVTALSLQLHQIRRGLEAAVPAGTPSTDLHQRLEASQLQVHRLIRLVTNLLDVARLQEGGMVPQCSPVDLATAAREIVHVLDVSAIDTETPVTLEALAPVVGYWDPTFVEQIIANLLGNAVKYGRGKPVSLRVEEADGCGILTVRDAGPGMTAEELGRIFERFVRLPAAKDQDGFGLGLWITRGLVTALGGTIQVASQPGQGATFTVRLPLSGLPSTGRPA